MSARKRGCFSTRQPPASKPKSASTNCGGWNVPSPLLERRPHAGVAEADDVGAAVAGDVGQEPRVLVHPPAAGLEAEVGEHELRRLERAVAVAQRRPHAGVAEADDVGPAVAGDVGEEARVLVDAPAAGLEAEVGEHELRRLERAVAVAQRRPHAGVAEADDVGPAVAGDVGQEARMLVDPPAAGLEAEVGEHEPRRLERAVAVAQRRPHAGVAEADDVGAAVAGDVGQEARVLVDAPAAGLEAEVGEHELRRLEGAVAVAQRRPHAGVAEADDVGPAVAGDVGQEARDAGRPASHRPARPKSASTTRAG